MIAVKRPPMKAIPPIHTVPGRRPPASRPRSGYPRPLQGFPVEVTYVAKIEDNDSLRGTIDIAGTVAGTFTGKRQPEDDTGADPQ